MNSSYSNDIYCISTGDVTMKMSTTIMIIITMSRNGRRKRRR